MTTKAPEIVFGAAGWGEMDIQTVHDFVAVLEKHHIKALDTAYIYTGSESVLGKIGAPKKFIIQTKAPALSDGAMSKKSILEGWEKQSKELGVENVDIYYFHGPDKTTPIEDSLSAIQELYAAGKFKRFGLSNFKPEDVQKVYDIQKSAHSVLPSVFQGNYNAVSRHTESNLFPLLHKLKISFYAYSPIAGGFLVKDSSSLKSGAYGGRWSSESMLGNMYNGMYGKETLYAALDEWAHIAKDAGISKAALAYRWVTYNSALKAVNGDAVIVGASSTEQLEETLAAVEAGPLDAKSAERIEVIWKKVEQEAPYDNYHSYMVDKSF